LLHPAAIVAVLRVRTAEQVFEAVDGALIRFIGAEVARRHARTRFAHSEPTFAVCSIPNWREDASTGWVASILGALLVVVTHTWLEVARAVHVVARVIGAWVAVVARVAFAEVLSAHPLDADPTRTAGCTIVRRKMAAHRLAFASKNLKIPGWLWRVAPIVRARVAVVAVHIPDAVLLPARRDAQGA
jgi:hypothetical protein